MMFQVLRWTMVHPAFCYNYNIFIRESYAPILGGLGVQKVRLERPSAKE